MQTFLPYPDYEKSAQVLDDKRLGKQRSESIIILKTLLGMYPARGGWPHHPATKMWGGHESALMAYTVAMCTEWRARGHKDTCLDWLCALAKTQGWPLEGGAPPYWWGLPRLHQSHRSNLLRKLPEHYRCFWPDEPADLPYYWPKPKLMLEIT